MGRNIRLRAARVVLGMTQLQLAEQVGLQEIQVSRYETGRAKPTPELKARIAALLKKAPYEIFERIFRFWNAAETAARRC